MPFTEQNQPSKRRARGRGREVTKSEVAAARNHLRDAAAAGDVQACAALIALAEGRPFPPAGGVAA